jgi:hypothetical protein
LAKPKEELDPTGKSTKNIVYKEVLNWWLTVGILKPFYQSSCEYILSGLVLDIFIFRHVGKPFYFLGFICYFIYFVCISIKVRWCTFAGAKPSQHTLCNTTRYMALTSSVYIRRSLCSLFFLLCW